jgi:hypothetical protein
VIPDFGPAPGSVTGSSTDSQGDKATVTVGFGEPKPMSTLASTAVATCDQAVTDQASTPERSIAIPISVTMQISSSLATDVVVNVNSIEFATGGGAVQSVPEVLANPTLWAGSYGSGPQCDEENSSSAGSIHWIAAVATPGSKQSWAGWVIILNAITPNDPRGLQRAQELLLQPAVTFAGTQQGDYTFDVPNSSSVVECSASDPAAGTLQYAAADPQVAVANGCTSPAPPAPTPAQLQTASDSVCQARYPGGVQRTVNVRGGTNTTDDRQASLKAVCQGFGAPQGLQLTPGMTCALIAAAATYGGPAVQAGTNNLCDASTVVEAYNSGGWVGAGAAVASDKGCAYFSDVFAGGVGLVAAGATSETGPGAVAVGVATYKALSAGLKIACGGLFAGGARSLGTKLEADNETHVALDIIRRGKCRLLSQLSGLSGTSWHATTCP